jgi:hypothetical protein
MYVGVVQRHIDCQSRVLRLNLQSLIPESRHVCHRLLDVLQTHMPHLTIASFAYAQKPINFVYNMSVVIQKSLFKWRRLQLKKYFRLSLVLSGPDVPPHARRNLRFPVVHIRVVYAHLECSSIVRYFFLPCFAFPMLLPFLCRVLSSTTHFYFCLTNIFFIIVFICFLSLDWIIIWVWISWRYFISVYPKTYCKIIFTWCNKTKTAIMI